MMRMRLQRQYVIREATGWAVHVVQAGRLEPVHEARPAVREAGSGEFACVSRGDPLSQL